MNISLIMDYRAQGSGWETRVGVQAKRITPEVMSRTICIFIIVDTQTVLSRFCDLASWLLLSMLVVIAFLKQ